jgi:outer membrane protein assembly factor BamB
VWPVTLQRSFLAGGFLTLGFVLWAGLGQAVISRLTPLRAVLRSEQLIFTVQVTKLDLDKPTVVFKVEEALKGKVHFQNLVVNLTADAEGQRQKHTDKLLKRLAPELSLVVFASKNARTNRYTAFAYTNGTWFQMIGQANDGAKAVRWSFSHCEPYLRRTFKGTTAELKDIITESLAGRREPPPPDPKAEPGLGPEIKADDRPAQNKGAAVATVPILAVIPTFVILGPMTLLASLLGLAGLALFLRRWMVLLSIGCLYITLILLGNWLRDPLRDSWWGTPQALWLSLAALTLFGMLWSWRRHRRASSAGRAEEMRVQRADCIILCSLSTPGLGAMLYAWGKGSHFPWPSRELLLASIGVWVGMLYALILRRFASRPWMRSAPSPEFFVLGVVTVAFAWLGLQTSPGALPDTPWESVATDGLGHGSSPGLISVAWTFKADLPGTLDATPLVTAKCIYMPGALRAGFSSLGILYCIDRTTGRRLWSFDDDGRMKQVFSSPCLAEGRVYVGEGYHQDSDCKLYCLDADSGQKVWEFQTKSHTESSPLVADGKVYFGAGEDGIYCLQATTGQEVWHFPGIHVDTSPAVAGNRLYVGTGYGDQYRFFCLEAVTGKALWQRRSDLPVFGSASLVGDQVFFGVGNGNFLESDTRPAGAVVCLRAEDGALVWRFDTPDAVHNRPAVDRRQVYFGSRDRHLYAVGRADGQLRWKRDLGSPIVTMPALITRPYCGDSSILYAVASGGLVACLDPGDGKSFWELDIAKNSRVRPQFLSSPQVVVSRTGKVERRWIYFGSGLENLVDWTARLYCLEDHSHWPEAVSSWQGLVEPWALRISNRSN